MLSGPHLARILVVDDQATNVLLMERMLERGGYRDVMAVTDSRRVLDAVADFRPDLILLDFHMPAPDGLTLLRQLSSWISPPVMVPVIMLTGNVETETRREALELGARDFMTKPFDVGEVLVRIRNVLEMRRLHLQIQAQNHQLEQTVLDRTSDMEVAQFELVERLALTAEYRDDETYEHMHRVGRCSALLAERLDFDAGEVRMIRRSAPFHDVGKIGVPDAILLKPGPLTAAEFETMKGHVTVGVNILSSSSSPVLRCAEKIALTHHERWDGTGYPHGLGEEEIPVVGQIVAVADAFDAITHKRPYKAAYPVSDALEEIRRCSGTHFAPEVVAAFETLDHARLLSPIAPVGASSRHHSATLVG